MKQLSTILQIYVPTFVMHLCDKMCLYFKIKDVVLPEHILFQARLKHLINMLGIKDLL
jgi:hypothetical protein